jgi:hypothetical protein
MNEQKADARRTAWRWIGRGVMVAIVLAGLASCSATNQAKDTQPNNSGVTNPAPTNPAPTSPAATSSAPTNPAPTPTGEGLCRFMSTATVEMILGGPIESVELEKDAVNDATTCSWLRDGNLAAAGLTASCAETGRVLAYLLRGATELEGSTPEAYNVNGKGGHVFSITEDGSCVLSLVVTRVDGSDTTKVLAAGLLEAYNAAKVHKP